MDKPDYWADCPTCGRTRDRELFPAVDKDCLLCQRRRERDAENPSPAATPKRRRPSKRQQEEQARLLYMKKRSVRRKELAALGYQYGDLEAKLEKELPL